VIRFFTLKGSSPIDIHTELESVYLIRGLDDPCKMILAMPFVVCFKNSHSLHASVSVYTSESQWILACASCTMFSSRKSSIYAGFRTLLMTLKKPNGITFDRPCEGSQRKSKTGFGNIITGDESWFYFEYPHQSL
jgi:hypothetical protein